MSYAVTSAKRLRPCDRWKVPINERLRPGIRLIPALHPTVTRTSAAFMLAKAISSIPAKGGVTLGPSVIVSGRTMNRCPVLIDIAVMPR